MKSIAVDMDIRSADADPHIIELFFGMIRLLLMLFRVLSVFELAIGLDDALPLRTAAAECRLSSVAALALLFRLFRLFR